MDCRGVGGRCREEWHIHKLPAVVLFKGGGDHEYHYGGWVGWVCGWVGE